MTLQRTWAYEVSFIVMQVKIYLSLSQQQRDTFSIPASPRGVDRYHEYTCS